MIKHSNSLKMITKQKILKMGTKDGPAGFSMQNYILYQQFVEECHYQIIMFALLLVI